MDGFLRLAVAARQLQEKIAMLQSGQSTFVSPVTGLPGEFSALGGGYDMQAIGQRLASNVSLRDMLPDWLRNLGRPVLSASNAPAAPVTPRRTFRSLLPTFKRPPSTVSSSAPPSTNREFLRQNIGDKAKQVFSNFFSSMHNKYRG
jgi:hypothetical protein